MHRGNTVVVRRKSSYLVDPVVVQSHTEFALIWAYVVLVHTFAGLCVLVVGLTYAVVLSLPEDNGSRRYLRTTDIELNSSAGWTFVVVGSAVVTYNLCSACQAVVRSFHAKKLVFQAKRVEVGAESDSSTVSVPCWQLPLLPFMWAWWWVSALAGRVGNVVGVRGDYFEAAFLLREVVEVAMQTLQCYNNSKCVTRVWLNPFSVVILVLNCWSTPIVHVLLRHQKVTTVIRCCCLATDVFLDLMASLLLPSIVLWPYIAIMLNTVSGEAPSAFSATWLVQTQSELRAVLFTSWPVMLAQLLPMISCIQALQDIKTLFNYSPKIAPSSSENQQDGSDPDFPTYVHTKTPILLKVAHGLFVVHGVVVLSLSIGAYSRGSKADQVTCLVQQFPWFGNRLSCAAIGVNCAHLHLQGDSDEIEHVVEPLELLGVRSISFANCPALQVPSIVTKMPDLLVLNIYNSTITRWDATAAITGNNLLGAVFIIASSLEPMQPTRFPSALLHNDVPSSLTTLRVMNSSIDIPDDFGSKWSHPMTVLAIDSCNLETVPTGLLSMRNIAYLSLSANAIRQVPSELFATAESLTLNGNPINQLPRVQPHELQTDRMWLVETSIAELPSWTANESYINAWGSPLCDSGIYNSSLVNCQTATRVISDNLTEWAVNSGLYAD